MRQPPVQFRISGFKVRSCNRDDYNYRRDEFQHKRRHVEAKSNCINKTKNYGSQYGTNRPYRDSTFSGKSPANQQGSKGDRYNT